MELIKLDEQNISVEITKGSLKFNKDDLVKGVEEIEKRYANLVIEEKDIQVAKKDMADLNKLKTAFSRKRIDTVNEFKEPIEQFEADMKELEKRVFDTRENIDVQVKDYENRAKLEKENEVREFFENHKTANNLDFITYEQAHINVTLSASMKSLKDHAKAFVEGVVADLKLIETQEHKERIRAEYEKSLNVSEAIVNITNAIKREEELKAQLEELANQKKEVLPEVKVEPVEEPKITAPKEIFETTFTVKGTREELITLREFMKEKGIKYEQTLF